MTEDQEELIKKATNGERRVQCVRALVSESAWSPSLAWRLEKEWGVTPDEVSSLYTDAVRSIDDNFIGIDNETRRAILASQLQHLASVALTKKKVTFTADGGVDVSPDPDVKAATEALKAYASVSGIMGPPKEELPNREIALKRIKEVLGIFPSPQLLDKKEES